MIGSGYVMPLIIEHLDHVISKIGGKDVISSLLLIGIAIESVVGKRAAGIHRVSRIRLLRRRLGIVDHQYRLIHCHLGICAPSIQSAVFGKKDKLGWARESFGNSGRSTSGAVHGWAGDRKFDWLSGQIAGGIVGLPGHVSDAPVGPFWRL